MKKLKVHFFLDYGCCFWCEDYEDENGQSIEPEALLSTNSKQELTNFLAEYNASYDLGLPPYQEHDVEYCKRFNSELKRVTDLIFPKIVTRFIICHDQFELVEDPAILQEARSNPSAMLKQRRQYYNINDETYS